MWSVAKLIADGDRVIIWQTRENIQPLVVTAGHELQTKFGYYRHSDLIGLPYGSKVGSRNGKGFIHVLRPTPELWTLALPHRTQILYLADIALITSYLHVQPGSRVIEAGTGSGSFTHSLARTVGSKGHVWSYEFHEQRAQKAAAEFSFHGMNDIVTLTQRNVCKDGFGVVNEADAVFLDLPAPWDAVDHAKHALRKDQPARICCFSPCMEQVLRTVNALNEAGFCEITMYETLARPTDIHQIPTPLPVSVVSERLHNSEMRREEKRLRQIAQTKARFQHHKRKRDEADPGDDGGDIVPDRNNGPPERPQADYLKGTGKRIKTQPHDNNGLLDTEFPEVIVPSFSEPTASVEQPLTTRTTPTEQVASSKNVSKIFPEVRGHTSYLTFACLIPRTDERDTPDLNVTQETPALLDEGMIE